MRSRSQVAALKTEIEDLKKQKINPQISQEQSMTNIPGYDEEFARLKEDAVKQIRKDKFNKIAASISSMIGTPVVGGIAYYAFSTDIVSRFFELDEKITSIIPTVIIVIFVVFELQALYRLISAIFIDPKVIPDQTLSYLSLTAKEHILDPKGSVIREKYGTQKWTSVTET